MEISWFGYACFRLRGREATIVTDPPSPRDGLPAVRLAADIVTVSHQHPNHNYVGSVSGSYRLLSGPGEYEIANVFIQGLSAFHDAAGGKERGKNVVFRFDVDELSVCHLGDIGHGLSSGQVEDLGNVDVLLVPVGGHSTINATQAAELTSAVQPRIVIPMHYNNGLAGETVLDTVDRFCKEMGASDLKPQARLNVTRSNLPANMQVVVLEQATRGGSR